MPAYNVEYRADCELHGGQVLPVQGTLAVGATDPADAHGIAMEQLIARDLYTELRIVRITETT